MSRSTTTARRRGGRSVASNVPEDSRFVSMYFDPVPSKEFPADRTAPSGARRFVSDTLRGWDVPRDVIADAVILVSELVTNAVLHAGTDAYVTLELDGPRLTVTVSDTGSRGSPQVVDVTSAGTRGRGLTLVQSVSDAFGSYPSPTGSTVWFEVDVELAERVGSGS